MENNQIDQLCEQCSSHIITYKDNNRIIIECSYCGSVPENIQLYNYEELE